MREFLRGAVRLHILHHAAHGEVHGAWMAQELAHHGYRISPGTLYPLLHRLEEKGYITSESEVVRGKVRRCYRITARGTRALENAKTKVRELFDELFEDQ